MRNSSAKLAHFTDLDITESRYYSNETFIKLQEVLLTTQNGFLFLRNHFMFHLTDRVTRDLIPTGILQRSRDYHFWFREGKDRSEEEGPQVLRVTDLSFGFVLWLVACSVSTAVFIFECILPKVVLAIRTAVGLV
jgi:hypothetical protein